MRYALNLAEDSRILSVTYEKYATPNQPLVDALPEGDVADYKYINGRYIYEPLPEPEPPEPVVTTDEILNALLGVES